jgi:F-type H+-transporting ATPase subunit delta
MRPPSRIARRYAAALFNSARRENAVDAVSADLTVMADIFAAHPQILEALAVPRIPTARKQAVLQAIVGDRVSQAVTRRFLDLTLSHDRESYLPETAEALALLARQRRWTPNR